EAGGADERRRQAHDRLVLEISFTALNRLAALRLCEERKLVVECVRKGTASDGFRLFERVSGGALGTRYQTYRVFLDGIFDELALDLGVLFDRFTPQSVVFPVERGLSRPRSKHTPFRSHRSRFVRGGAAQAASSHRASAQEGPARPARARSSLRLRPLLALCVRPLRAHL